jgi:quinol monooxygenase YgiN
MIVAKQLLIAGASMIAAAFSGSAFSEETEGQYVQVAQIEIDPAQLEDYRAAVSEQIDAAIREEPGVLVLYAVSDKDNPAHITVFEIYKNMAAYKSHLETAHFQEIQGSDREDGEVACAGSKLVDHARRKGQVKRISSVHLR